VTRVVDNAKVKFTSITAASGPATVITDANGSVGPIALEPGTYRLTGPTGKTFTVTVLAGDSVELRFIRAGAKVTIAALHCTGTGAETSFVLDPDHAPVCPIAPGAEVIVRGEQGNIIATIEVGPDGTFSTILPPGNYTFTEATSGRSYDVAVHGGAEIVLQVVQGDGATPTLTATPEPSPAATATPEVTGLPNTGLRSGAPPADPRIPFMLVSLLICLGVACTIHRRRLDRRVRTDRRATSDAGLRWPVPLAATGDDAAGRIGSSSVAKKGSISRSQWSPTSA
jgi:hypothetical protein